MEGRAKCIKYLIFIFNLLFFLSGCTLIGLGIWLNVDRDDWEGISDYTYISVANVCIVAGAIIVVVAFLGCCGAITENRYMLLVFFVCMVVIFLLEVGAGISAYAWRGEIDSELRSQVEKRIPERYYTETGIKNAMDNIQEHFKCCGIDGFSDWIQPVDGESSVDESCCITDSSNINYAPGCTKKPFDQAVRSQNQYYQKGCYNSIKEFLEDNLMYIGVFAILFAIFQVIGMVFALYLFCAIKKESLIV